MSVTVTRAQFKALHRNARRGDYGHDPKMAQAWGFYCIRDHVKGGCSYSGMSYNANLHGTIVMLLSSHKSINPAVRRMTIETVRKLSHSPVRIP